MSGWYEGSVVSLVLSVIAIAAVCMSVALYVWMIVGLGCGVLLSVASLVVALRCRGTRQPNAKLALLSGLH